MDVELDLLQTAPTGQQHSFVGEDKDFAARLSFAKYRDPPGFALSS
ncbi:hypothetical protein [Paraburkholderia sediminicola]